MNNSAKPTQTGQTSSVQPQLSPQPSPQLVGDASLKLRPKTKQELALEYAVHPQTLANWCRAIAITGRKKLSVPQLIIFYKHYGYPGTYSFSVKLD